ncbi:MAG: hypothetical protein E6Q38_02315 [Crocinitomicaceae bacterium]|nr:MAG: hypothetical protein E6Q38_02315 [Crocinitomicaceae bacterium]
MSILVFGFFLFQGLFVLKNDLLDYTSEKGSVELICASKVNVKPRAKYDMRSVVEEDAIEIRVKGKSFFVRYQLDRHKKNVSQKIHVGDTVIVYYAPIENHLELYEIIKNDESILNYSERHFQGTILKFVFGLLVSLSTFVLILIVRLRKKYLSKKGNIFG